VFYQKKHLFYVLNSNMKIFLEIQSEIFKLA